MYPQLSPDTAAFFDALHHQLKFTLSHCGQWWESALPCFTNSPEEFIEQLPVTVRVSRDARRLEVGARREDLEAFLDLARIVYPTAGGVEEVAAFWQGNKTFSACADGDHLFIGCDILPTKEGFEERISGLDDAFSLAIHGAVYGNSYDYYKSAPSHSLQSHLLSRIEESPQVSHVFDLEEDPEENIETAIIPRRQPPVQADSLLDFPLADQSHSLSMLPGTVTWAGQTLVAHDFWIIAHNGGAPKVDMYAHIGKRNDPFHIVLAIPEGTEILTAGDLRKLTALETGYGPKNFPEGKFEAEVTVSDESIQVASRDGALQVRVDNVTCGDCHIPYWKFPLEHRSGGFLPHGAASPAGCGTRYLVQSGRIRGCFCADCYAEKDRQYQEAHPMTNKLAALQAVQDEMRNQGYTDVHMDESYLYRTSGGWQGTAIVMHERAGLPVERTVGWPFIHDSGKINLQMRPREFIDYGRKGDA